MIIISGYFVIGIFLAILTTIVLTLRGGSFNNFDTFELGMYFIAICVAWPFLLIGLIFALGLHYLGRAIEELNWYILRKKGKK